MVGVTQEKTLTDLNRIVQDEVSKYAGYSPQEQLYTVFDQKQQMYTVIGVPNAPRSLPVSVVVMARVVNEWVVIEEDTTDKPLYEALMANAGVPREQIILAYAGEVLPDEKSQ